MKKVRLEPTACPVCGKVLVTREHNDLECRDYPVTCGWFLPGEVRALTRLIVEQTDCTSVAEVLNGLAFGMVTDLDIPEAFEKLRVRMIELAGD